MILENKNKPKLMWKYLRELLPRNSNPEAKSLTIDDKIVIDPTSIANVFYLHWPGLDKHATKYTSIHPTHSSGYFILTIPYCYS